MWGKNNQQACRDMFLRTFQVIHIPLILTCPRCPLGTKGNKCAVQNQADLVRREGININVYVQSGNKSVKMKLSALSQKADKNQ